MPAVLFLCLACLRGSRHYNFGFRSDSPNGNFH
jgi:hypothetical protein